LGALQVWNAMLEFGQHSETWSSTAITDVNGTVQLSIEDIRRQVDEYTTRAYKAGKAAKDVSTIMGGAACRPPACSQLRHADRGQGRRCDRACCRSLLGPGQFARRSCCHGLACTS
jgi:hypothetical protein